MEKEWKTKAGDRCSLCQFFWFEDLDHVSLATGAAFGELEVDAGPPIGVVGVDVANVFHNMLLPEELLPYFRLQIIRAEMLNATHAVEGLVSPSELVVPVLNFVPMGWTHALWVCQWCHEITAERASSESEANRSVDRKVPPM